MSLEIGQLVKERYRIEAILGEGGMGTVYLAQDVLFDRQRAIKELCPDPLSSEAQLLASRAQFEQEALTLSKLRHRNLPHVSDHFSVDENDYLVMDYVQGESLADILARGKRPTESLVYDWLVQILDALEYCHRHQVLHRDIKPANLIVTPEGRISLVDFSLVKLLDRANPRTATIVRGLGTPQYTPLEQYDATVGHTDERSDIYSLGATFYHLLTGRAPQSVSQRILKPDTQPPIQEINPKISPWLADFIRRAMCIRPEDRYQSVREMRRQLDTRLFKLKRRSMVEATARRSRLSRQNQHRRHTEQTTGWDSSRTRGGTSQDSPLDLVPVVLPVLVPIAVIVSLTVVVTVILSVGPSLLTALLGSPLVIGALIYYALTTKQRKPPWH
jgi:serine/threonine-protein kinase